VSSKIYDKRFNLQQHGTSSGCVVNLIQQTRQYSTANGLFECLCLTFAVTLPSEPINFKMSCHVYVDLVMSKCDKLHCDFDLLTSKSNQFIFVPNCIAVVNVVKFTQFMVCKILS